MFCLLINLSLIKSKIGLLKNILKNILCSMILTVGFVIGDAIEVVDIHGVFPLNASHARRLTFGVALAILFGATSFGVGATDRKETKGHKCQHYEAKFHLGSPFKTLSLGLKDAFLDRRCRIGKLYSVYEEVFGVGTICPPGALFAP